MALLVYRQDFFITEVLPVSIPIELSANQIVLEVEAQNAKPNWIRAGVLQRRLLISSIGFVEDERKQINLGRNLLEFSQLGNYRLIFSPTKWLNGQIKITMWTL